MRRHRYADHCGVLEGLDDPGCLLPNVHEVACANGDDVALGAYSQRSAKHYPDLRVGGWQVGTRACGEVRGVGAHRLAVLRAEGGGNEDPVAEADGVVADR